MDFKKVRLSAVVLAVGLVQTVANAKVAFHSKKRPAIRECAFVVDACQKGGFVRGAKNRHPGVGLWSGCVSPLSQGRVVLGVTGVSKRAALLCLKARRAADAGKS